MSKVTIRDVAKLAGVSISTVSRVVAEKGLVNQETVEKVREAIEKTGYQPNYIARALATKSTDTIGVIVDRSPALSLRNSYFVEVLEAIATELAKNDKDMLVVFSEDNNLENRKVKKLINSKKIDGFIKLSVLKDDKTIGFLSESKTPTVVIGSPEIEDGIISIDNDNIQSMKNVVQYHIDKGRNKIAFVGGNLSYIVSAHRKEGYRLALEENGIEYDEDLVFCTEFTIEDGYNIAQELLNRKIDAVACTDDLIAVGIANRYSENKQKIAISGFNNTYYSMNTKIPITTVDINVRELGKKSVELLMDFIQNGTIIDKSFIETKIIIREQ